MLLHPKQKEIVSSNARFKVTRAGRKGGKTSLEVEVLCHKAIVSAKKLNLSKTIFPTGRKVIYKAPTQDQARKIIWEALKNRLAGIGVPNEQQLSMKLKNEDGDYSTIYIGGWENRENDRGMTDVVHVTFDETDTLKNFFVAWKEIYRPMFLDTSGSADFIGTPKKENPNLRRLEKEAEGKMDWACFHFTSRDNPFLSREELIKLEEDYRDDRNTYKQEILAEHLENSGALFKYTALIDMFSNTIDKTNEKYLIIDVADDGTDKTIFNFFNGLESYRIESFERLNTEGIINQTREYQREERIPMSHTAVDAIGVGAGVASSSLLDGIVGFKSSYGAIKTDIDPVRLPNVHYVNDAPLVSEYANLRSQCVFILSQKVNNHEVACKVEDVRIKERIIEELSLYQDVSSGDGKRMATKKEDIKAVLGRSPDLTDTFIMRMYFAIRDKMLPFNNEEEIRVRNEQDMLFDIAFRNQEKNSSM